MDSKKYLWEILIPTLQHSREIPLSHHHSWDDKIRAISGGLTILKTAKGQWKNPSGELFVEPMIPVRIMCTADQIDHIADMTSEHYRQQAVMYYRVSSDVIIKHYPHPPGSKAKPRNIK